MTPYPSGKKNKQGKPYLYYACTSVSQYGEESDCTVRSLPGRQFKSIVKKALCELGRSKTLLDARIKAANVDAQKGVRPLLVRKRENENRLRVLTSKIRRLIHIMAETDSPGEDVKEEYKEAVKEKEVQVLEGVATFTC